MLASGVWPTRRSAKTKGTEGCTRGALPADHKGLREQPPTEGS